MNPDCIKAWGAPHYFNFKGKLQRPEAGSKTLSIQSILQVSFPEEVGNISVLVFVSILIYVFYLLFCPELNLPDKLTVILTLHTNNTFFAVIGPNLN